MVVQLSNGIVVTHVKRVIRLTMLNITHRGGIFHWVDSDDPEPSGALMVHGLVSEYHMIPIIKVF